MSKLKDLLYVLEQCKATVSYMVMAWTVNNTVAHHINNKVNNKLVSDLTDQEMHVLNVHILKQAGWWGYSSNND